MYLIIICSCNFTYTWNLPPHIWKWHQMAAVGFKLMTLGFRGMAPYALCHRPEQCCWYWAWSTDEMRIYMRFWNWRQSYHHYSNKDGHGSHSENLSHSYLQEQYHNQIFCFLDFTTYIRLIGYLRPHMYPLPKPWAMIYFRP